MTSTSVDSRIKVERQPPREHLEKIGIFDWPVWQKEASVFDWHYDSQEVCYFLEGEVTVKTDQGEVSFGKGDLVTFPSGLDCIWHIQKAVKKHYRFG